MLEDLVKRKQIELDLKLDSLKNELSAWCARSEENGPLEKHNSQLLALQAHLNGWHNAIRNKLNEYNARGAESYLNSCDNAEKLILSEHRIWEYFRQKLIQRHEQSFIDFLQAADEFAWACYEPVQKVVYPRSQDAKRKEPPLVFFNGGLSPFSVSRGKTFQPERVAGEVLVLDPEASLTKLPVPVVGVPWDQVSHLPAVLVIGHEVGHIVEDDFGLTGDLQEVLKAAITLAKAEKRANAWNSWLGEIFADLYGCLAGGPAFAGTLIDFLVKGKDRISSEEKVASKWGSYPTDYLRGKIVIEALKKMNFGAEVAEYEKLWKNFSSRMPKEYETDIEHIVSMLLSGKQEALGNKSIQDIFIFSEDRQRKAKETLESLARISADTIVEIPSRDIRVLFAALRLSYELDPARYVRNDYGGAVLEHIKSRVIQKGVRGGQEVSQSKLKAFEQDGADWVNQMLDVVETGPGREGVTE